MVVFSTEGVKRMVALVTGGASVVDLRYHLFVNDLSPINADAGSAQFTECALSGYVSFDLLDTDWTLTAGGGVCVAVYPAITFSFDAYSGGTAIYGYYVTFASETTWLYGDRLPKSYDVPATGGSLVQQPMLQLRACP